MKKTQSQSLIIGAIALIVGFSTGYLGQLENSQASLFGASINTMGANTQTLNLIPRSREMSGEQINSVLSIIAKKIGDTYNTQIVTGKSGNILGNTLQIEVVVPDTVETTHKAAVEKAKKDPDVIQDRPTTFSIDSNETPANNPLIDNRTTQTARDFVSVIGDYLGQYDRTSNIAKLVLSKNRYTREAITSQQGQKNIARVYDPIERTKQIIDVTQGKSDNVIVDAIVKHLNRTFERDYISTAYLSGLNKNTIQATRDSYYFADVLAGDEGLLDKLVNDSDNFRILVEQTVQANQPSEFDTIASYSQTILNILIQNK